MSGSKFILSAAVLGTLLGIGSASAADLPARTYTKAPTVVAAPSWTGFYIFGGAGGGVWDANNYQSNLGNVVTINQKTGGDGFFGTAGAGYDWQFNRSWVAGILADGQFGGLKGQINGVSLAGPVAGSEKLLDTWAVGGRAGYLVAPNVLSYVNAGYTQSYWSSSALGLVNGAPATIFTPSFNKGGWFVGGGVENNLDIFGITAPGLFMKTEYRGAYFGRADLTESNAAGPTTAVASFKPFVQTISTSLVYRFNWTGPVVAKY